ncbi:MAG: hypothetical protein IGR80_07765 [Synechococcales cyanobacterium K44_A2020_017]|nr:hypothetical protein [Synechococcales cyanobacterium K32_A2020_035]MBF2094643.1 hypothetical protein [Synechococcales cyanobacterium K44_A2020_017]
MTPSPEAPRMLDMPSLPRPAPPPTPSNLPPQSSLPSKPRQPARSPKSRSPLRSMLRSPIRAWSRPAPPVRPVPAPPPATPPAAPELSPIPPDPPVATVPPSPPPRSPKPPVERRPPKRLIAVGRSLAWTSLWLGALALSGGLSMVAYQRLTDLPPVPDCRALSPLSADAERLFCAREAAQSGYLGDLTSAVDLVRDWPENHPLQRETQVLLQDWSRALLKLAKAEIEQSNLFGAVDIASRIPANSPVYEEAQEAIAAWQYQWQEGEAIYDEAQVALQQQDWDEATAQLRALGQLQNDYWRQQQVDALAQQILLEQEAWRVLQQARQLAAQPNPEQLGAALRLVQTISPQSYAWRAGEAELNRWSQLLISYGMQQWEQGNLEAAIALVEPVPPDPNLAPEAYDFLQFSYAQRRAEVDIGFWKPTLAHLAGLLEAIATAQQIRPESPFYDQAQTSLVKWQAQVEDGLHLNLSDAIARVGGQTALNLAIAYAGQIEADRPRRLQAQTLVAHWQQEIQRLEDRPILLQAQQLAGENTIPSLQAAITQAQAISQERALRIEAQTAIATWRKRIELIEDQPLLDEAIALAQEGRLSDAIRAAQRIDSDRALYADAQGQIQAWQSSLRNQAIATDQPLLDEAYSLAARQWYSAAIDAASRIGPDRPLYGDAQAAIGQWRIERDALLQQWGVQSAQSSSEPAPSRSQASRASDDETYRDYYSPTRP